MVVYALAAIPAMKMPAAARASNSEGAELAHLPIEKSSF